jgi:K+-transporting ATPase KdpF subunit
VTPLESQDVGHNIPDRDRHILRGGDGLRMGVQQIMTPWEVALGLVMAIGLTVYLVYAMLRPEKF